MEDKILQLKRAKELLDQGLINQIEFDKLKKEILGTAYSFNPDENIIASKPEIKTVSTIQAEKVNSLAMPNVITPKASVNVNIIENGSTSNYNKNSTNDTTPYSAKQKPNKLLVYLFSIIGLLLLTWGVIFSSKSIDKSIENKIANDSTRVDSSKLVNGASLNEWLKKATGYDFNLDNSRISFETKNYSISDTSIKLNVSGSEENGVKNPKSNYYNSYIVIEFENGWKHHIFLTNNLVINSIHYGSHGESVLYNLNTKSSNILDYEITNINGKEAVIMSSGHDSTGGFVNNTGKLNLETLEVIWDNSTNQINSTRQNDNPDIDGISGFRSLYQSMMDASISGDVNKEVDFYSESCSYYGELLNKSQISNRLTNYNNKWKAKEYRVFNFKKINTNNFEYEISLKIQNKNTLKEFTYHITGVITFDNNGKISNQADYSQNKDVTPN